jgi:hypothetical protein
MEERRSNRRTERPLTRLVGEECSGTGKLRSQPAYEVQPGTWFLARTYARGGTLTTSRNAHGRSWCPGSPFQRSIYRACTSSGGICNSLKSIR